MQKRKFQSTEERLRAHRPHEAVVLKQIEIVLNVRIMEAEASKTMRKRKLQSTEVRSRLHSPREATMLKPIQIYMQAQTSIDWSPVARHRA